MIVNEEDLPRGDIRVIRANIGKAVTKAVGFFTENIGYKALRGAVRGIFDNFTATQLYEAILSYNKAIEKGETPLDIWSVNWGSYEEFRDQFRRMAQQQQYRQHLNKLTVENVMVWLNSKDERQDLASVLINTPHGFEWLAYQLECIIIGLTAPKPEENVVQR